MSDATPSSPTSQGTSRRTNQSTSEESAPALPIVEKGLRRVATPHLRPLYDWISDEDAAEARLGETAVVWLKSATLAILQRHRVQPPNPDLGASYEDMQSSSNVAPMEDDHIHVVSRGDPEYADSFRLTVRIIALWDDDDTSASVWEEAVRDIKRAADGYFGTTDDPGISNAPNLEVEIVSQCLLATMYLDPVSSDPAMEDLWNNRMLPHISQMLWNNPTTRHCVSTIVLCRLGFQRRRPLNNPITVYVALDDKSDEKAWHGIVAGLKSYLGSIDKTLRLKFEHNTWRPSGYALKPPTRDLATQDIQPGDDDPYQQRAHMGADIGCAKYVKDRRSAKEFNPLMGTLGCYVDLELGGQWRKFGLTNYHVIRPMLQGFFVDSAVERPLEVTPLGTVLYNRDRNGVKSAEALSLGDTIEHPCRWRHNRNMKIYGIRIVDANRGDDDEDEANKIRHLAALRDEKQKFCDDDMHMLGRVFAASGFGRKSPAGHRMDWALIEVFPHRQGDNSLPSRAFWERWNQDLSRPIPSSAGAYNRLSNPHASSRISTFQSGTRVWKIGAASGPTTGAYSKLKAHIGIPESKYVGLGKTEEHVFTPAISASGTKLPALGAAGDSGSVIFNIEGVAVGLLFRGTVPKQVSSEASWLTYVTPIEDVFEDIKSFTGATAVRISQ